MDKKNAQLRTDMGRGMAMGIAAMVLVSILVNWTTGDDSIWSWSIPVGVAIGTAIGAGMYQTHSKESNYDNH